MNDREKQHLEDEGTAGAPTPQRPADRVEKNNTLWIAAVVVVVVVAIAVLVW